MNQNNLELPIKEEATGLSSSTSLLQSHLQIKIPPFSSHFQYEPIKNQNPSVISTPHKRPTVIMPPTLTSLTSHHKAPTFPKPDHSLFCCSSCHSSWIRVHLRQLFILLLLPSFYFVTLTHHLPIFLIFFLAFVLSIVVIFLSLAISILPSVGLFLARTLCLNLSSPPDASKPNPPVVWSIGTKPDNSEKMPHSGFCVQVYSNGDVFEGEFHKGKCSGGGVYYYHMSGRYEGDWVDDKYDGHGIEMWAKGSRYRGQYRQGLRHGVGVYSSYSGDAYAGEWCNGLCHGMGVHTCEDGSSYVGEFKWGVKHGLGHYHFRNGDTYAGEYFADKLNGFGVYQFGNGHRYEGAWHEGRRQGFGTYTFRNGDTQSGHWQNGVLNLSSNQVTVPGSSLVDHSKVLNAVQEARLASEKAVNIEKVNERVNGAVALANRSASAARVAAVKAVQSRMYLNHSSCNVPVPVV